jgi:hypothetical protein
MHLNAIQGSLKFGTKPYHGLPDLGRCLRSAACLLGVLGACMVLPPVSTAASIPFPLTFFNVVNTNADGTALSADGGISAVITGGNNGSGLTGTTDLIATAPADVTIAFQFIYMSADAPTFDWAGFLVNDLFTQVADTSGESGNATFSVLAGETFGFRVATADNTSEPGVFTVSDFIPDGTATPEPSTQFLILGAGLFLTVGRALRRTLQRTREIRS